MHLEFYFRFIQQKTSFVFSGHLKLYKLVFLNCGMDSVFFLCILRDNLGLMSVYKLGLKKFK